jgi:hypothetical protein
MICAGMCLAAHCGGVTMRGKIIHYSGADGQGIIMAGGQQYPFTIGSWQAESVPTPGNTVDIAVDDGTVTGVSLVSDDILRKEKTAELGSRLGSALGNVDLSALQGSGGEAIVARYGKMLLGAYALFVIGSLAFNAISVSFMGNGMGKSLFGVTSLLSELGGDGGGSIKMMLILAYLGCALPLLWPDRRAWLALLLPLLATLWAIFAVLSIVDSMGGGMMGDMSDLISINFGFYLSLLAALVLAAGGARRFLSAAKS